MRGPLLCPCWPRLPLGAGPSHTPPSIPTTRPPGCFDAASCRARPPSLTSSKAWPATAAYSGLLDATEPRLGAANAVFLRYCTNDAWAGSAPAPLPGFSMLGRPYVSAVLAQLAAAHGLGSAPGTRLLFTGCSAGARGALFNTHHVQALLPSLFPPARLAAFGALYDSAWWMDVAPLSPTAVPFAQQVRDVYALVGAGAPGYLNPACTAAFPASEGWKCMMGEFATNYTQADYIAHVYQFDSFQLGEDVGHTPQTPAELAYANAFRGSLVASLQGAVVAPARAGTRLLAPACYHHCNTQGASFGTATTDGTTLQAEVAGWFFGLPGGAGRYVVERCSGFACGQGCPKR